MHIGFNLPISGPLSSPKLLASMAQEAEALGNDYLTVTDHVVLPIVRKAATQTPTSHNASRH